MIAFKEIGIFVSLGVRSEFVMRFFSRFPRSPRILRFSRNCNGRGFGADVKNHVPTKMWWNGWPGERDFCFLG